MNPTRPQICLCVSEYDIARHVYVCITYVCVSGSIEVSGQSF
jgi:hypothetical protein